MEEQQILNEIDNLRNEMIDAMMTLIRIPAIGPENGGSGELEKAEKLSQMLTDIGFDKIERFDAEDERISSGRRPNIIACLNGESSGERLWIVTHLDVVPPGEESLWTLTRPFKPLAKDNRVYGRGTEDNAQPLIASIFAAKALKRLGLKPERTLSLAFVADEEQGSVFGIQHLIKKGLFEKGDLILVPDGGNSDGSLIEIIEKSLLWFSIRTIGKQTHGSLPNLGLNANRIGMQVALALDEKLHSKYSLSDAYFNVPTSTFEPTKKESNVDAVNIVPGEDVICFDCRILPVYDVDEVLADICSVLREFEDKTGASIRLEIIQKDVAPKLVDLDSKIVGLLKQALLKVRNLDAYVGGIGGGTCAAHFRRVGIPAVVWSTIDDVCHQPDEYSKIENMIADAKIFALLAVM